MVTIKEIYNEQNSIDIDEFIEECLQHKLYSHFEYVMDILTEDTRIAIFNRNDKKKYSEITLMEFSIWNSENLYTFIDEMLEEYIEEEIENKYEDDTLTEAEYEEIYSKEEQKLKDDKNLIESLIFSAIRKKISKPDDLALIAEYDDAIFKIKLQKY